MFLGDFMKLSEFSKQNTQENDTQTAKVQKNINDSYNELKNCSSDELMSRLAKEVQQQKSNGTFDYDGLLNSIEKIKIYLPTQTYENMLRIIENLK